MKLVIEIATDNAAFSGAGEGEVARILRWVARSILEDGVPSPQMMDMAARPIATRIRDINGNTVGEYRWKASS